MISPESGPGEAMIAALTDLWRLSAPGPDNLLADPAFLRLRETCRAGYPSCRPTGPNFALSAALRSLGLPYLRFLSHAQGKIPDKTLGCLTM